MRFFFSASDEPEADDYGVEVDDLAAARRLAIQYAGAIIKDQPDVLETGQAFNVAVTDERGALLFLITVAAIDSPRGGGPDPHR